MINSYVAFDIETTGLDPATDKVIEIGAVKVEEGRMVKTYNRLINPQIMITEKISELTGIDSKMLITAPLVEDIIEEFIDFTEDLPVLGHNIIFDFSFIKKAAFDKKIIFEKKGIDTLKMAKRILPDLPHKNLRALCEYLQVNPGNSHRALDDAISALGVYEKLYELNPKDRGFLEPEVLNYTIKKSAPITEAQVSYLSSLLHFHKLTLEEELSSMSRSQASKLIDSIISKYGRIYKR